MRKWLDRMQTEGWLEAGVVYGYYRCVSEGNDVVLLGDDGAELTRFTFPRQRRDKRLCLADYFRSRDSGETDVIALQVVTIGSKVSEATAELFAELANQAANRFTGGFTGNWRPSSWLATHATVGYDVVNRTDVQFWPTGQVANF